METIQFKNIAFEFLREFKECSDETEKLVLAQSRKRFHVTNIELKTIFENGISGNYGKLYQADPQTLLGWIEKFISAKGSSKNYLESALLPITTSEIADVDWFKEANKCFQAFRNGVSYELFHHMIYVRMNLDDKIPNRAYKKYCAYTGQEGWTEDLRGAARKVLRDVFTNYLNKGFTYVYFIKE